MGDVVILPVETKLPIPVDRVLDAAKVCNEVLVLGWEGDRMYTAYSECDLARALFLATKFIHKVHAGDYDGTD